MRDVTVGTELLGGAGTGGGLLGFLRASEGNVVRDSMGSGRINVKGGWGKGRVTGHRKITWVS